MSQFNQWVATATEVLIALGETPRVGTTPELFPSGNGRMEFWVVEKERIPKVGYSVDDVKAFKVSNTQMRNFFENKGEILPAEIEVRVRPAAKGGLFNDEVVIYDPSKSETKL